MAATILAASFEIRVVEPGTLIGSANGDSFFTVDDSAYVIDQTRGIAWLTQRHFDMLKQSIGTAPAEKTA